jgi:hypothetical protein
MNQKVINNLTWFANVSAELYVYGGSGKRKLKHLKEMQDKLYDALRSNIDLTKLTVEEAKEMRFKRWSEEEPDLYLFPLWIVPIIPEGFIVHTIGNRELEYHKDCMDNDIRFGCVAYGIIIKD